MNFLLCRWFIRNVKAYFFLRNKRRIYVRMSSATVLDGTLRVNHMSKQIVYSGNRYFEKCLVIFLEKFNILYTVAITVWGLFSHNFNGKGKGASWPKGCRCSGSWSPLCLGLQHMEGRAQSAPFAAFSPCPKGYPFTGGWTESFSVAGLSWVGTCKLLHYSQML